MKLRVEPLESRDTPSAAGFYAFGAGPGSPPRVKVYATQTNALVGDFLAFENTFTGGVNVAVGDVSNDGIADLIVAAGQGGGPRVRVIDGRAFTGSSAVAQVPRNGAALNPASLIADFFAFEVAQRGGTYVTSSNLTGNANAEVIVGAGPGGGPRVRSFDGNAIATKKQFFNATQVGDVSSDFFAFESTFRNGVLVSASPSLPSVTSTFLTVTPGKGGSPRVRVLNGSSITLNTTNYRTDLNGAVVSDFFAYNSTERNGAFISTADYNRDGTPDVAVGSGVGSAGFVKIYSGTRILQLGQGFTGNESGSLLYSAATGGGNYTNGVSVGSAVVASSLLEGLFLQGYGTGGQNNVGQIFRFNLASGGLTPQLLNNVFFDANAVGGVFAGN